MVIGAAMAGSGPNLRFRFAIHAEPGPPTRFSLTIFLDLNLNMRFGPGANPVRKVRTLNRGQYTGL
jgi:hypothetical protein